ncbi:type II toxin-antitoxin system death-on-curing family toxin [Thalassobaculum sp.]|uniref:type II toxin-antitoxin system death-on-curing family toxin n=1 Tax=Thalassobaculum sp. TaxID=2022740 RepID=UPI0032EAD985
MAIKGRTGILSEAGLQSALDRPYSGYYRPIYAKAAALVESLTQNHGFLDGNKRTAVALMFLMLHRSRYSLGSNDDEIERMVIAAATGDMRFEALKAWFKASIMSFDEIFDGQDG